MMSDMSELKKTLSIAGIAVLLGAVAIVSAPRRAAPDAFFDVGEPFFPGVHRSGGSRDAGGDRVQTRSRPPPFRSW